MGWDVGLSSITIDIWIGDCERAASAREAVAEQLGKKNRGATPELTIFTPSFRHRHYRFPHMRRNGASHRPVSLKPCAVQEARDVDTKAKARGCNTFACLNTFVEQLKPVEGPG
jgi:hypothetical protein